jgi:hypothetical protein
MRDLGFGQGDTTGEPRRAEVTEAGGPSIVSKGVASSVVQGVDLRKREQDILLLNWKQDVPASISTQRCVCSATGELGGGSSKPRRSAASRQRMSVKRGG